MSLVPEACPDVNHLKINENRAVLDGDGVILDFDGSFAKVACDVLGRSVAKACQKYSLDERYGLTKAEFGRVWDAMEDHDSGWAGLAILPGAAQAVQQLKAHGLEVYMVTGIASRLASVRLANLARYGIELDGIECVGDGLASKADEVAKIAPVMFVEDRLRLLHESHFVPDRVWIDHGDDQDGHVVTEDIIRCTSLSQWVNQWSLRHARPTPSNRLRLVK